MEEKPTILIYEDNTDWLNKLETPLVSFKPDYKIVSEKDPDKAKAIITGNCALAVLNVITNSDEKDSIKNWKKLLDICKDKVAVITVSSCLFSDPSPVTLFQDYYRYKLGWYHSFYTIDKHDFTADKYKAQVEEFINNLKNIPIDLTPQEIDQLSEQLTERASWKDRLSRENLLFLAGIPKTTINDLPLDGDSPITIASNVIIKLERVGKLADKTTHTALGCLIYRLFLKTDGQMQRTFCANTIIKNNLILENSIINELSAYLSQPT